MNRHVVGLVQCGSKKQDLDGDETVPAKDLYTAGYFTQKFDVGEEFCDESRIVSAEHGVVEPDEQIGYYDTELKELTPEERADLFDGITFQLQAIAKSRSPFVAFVVLISGSYLDDYPDDQGRTLRDVIDAVDATPWYAFDDTGSLFEQQSAMADWLDQGALPIDA